MIVTINAKCSDMCQTIVKDKKGNILADRNGYVPTFMPDEHYGDYVILDIDVKTGKILNWKTTEKQVQLWMKGKN